MSDPTHSSDWTGLAKTPTYASGQSSVSDLYQNMLRAQQELDELGPQVRALRRLAARLLVSPLTLWFAFQFVRIVIPDQLASNQSGLLAIWTSLVVIVAVGQLKSNSRKLVASGGRS